MSLYLGRSERQVPGRLSETANDRLGGALLPQLETSSLGLCRWQGRPLPSRRPRLHITSQSSKLVLHVRRAKDAAAESTLRDEAGDLPLHNNPSEGILRHMANTRRWLQRPLMDLRSGRNKLQVPGRLSEAVDGADRGHMRQHGWQRTAPNLM